MMHIGSWESATFAKPKRTITNNFVFFPLPIPNDLWPSPFDVLRIGSLYSKGGGLYLCYGWLFLEDEPFYCLQYSRVFCRKVVHIHSVAKMTPSNRDTKFLSHFWIILRRMFEETLKKSSNPHLLTDGQTEFTNHTLGNTLRSVFDDKPKQWNVTLSQIGFAYNSVVHNATGRYSFSSIYIPSPRHVIDLIKLLWDPWVDFAASNMAKELQVTKEAVKMWLAATVSKNKAATDKYCQKN